MLHKMNLHCQPFDKIAKGEKDIELRLFDEKRQQLNVGDEIQFDCNDRSCVLLAVVGALNVYKDFQQLYNSEPLERCGYNSDTIVSASHTDMQQYYSKEQVAKYGVVAIYLKDVTVKEVADDHIGDDNSTSC